MSEECFKGLTSKEAMDYADTLLYLMSEVTPNDLERKWIVMTYEALMARAKWEA